MTVTHVEQNYLETPYLENAYLGVDVLGYMGMQCTIVIAAAPATGQQSSLTIADRQGATGQQANLVIATGSAPRGHQADFTVEAQTARGMQTRFAAADFERAGGMQAELFIDTFRRAYGMEYKQDNFAHSDCFGYLEEPGYLEDSYLARGNCAAGGMNVNFDVTKTPGFGMEAEFHIVNRLRAFGQETEFHINDRLRALGMETEIHIANRRRAFGQQAEIEIVDHLKTLGQNTLFRLTKTPARGMQAEIINLATLGMQATISLYNTNRLRILCEFPSRGLSTATGLNAWGNAAGQGLNWKSNSTESGDFAPENLNTDIVEQVWRSAAPMDSGINLDCDTERPQGVFLDTFAILNHNMTSSAVVNLIGSTSPTFATIGVTIPLEVRPDDPNIYYIAPVLPNAGYRYWRISIDDNSNPDEFVEIGTIVFGAASIFFGEAFVDEVTFQLKDFTDSVQTEGFTNVNNSRAQKKLLALEFRSLSYLRANFRIMRNMFRTERTVLKCLWIPTPDATNQEYTARFALFSKLVQIPSEKHNHKGGDADYVSFSIELDESK